MTYIDLDRFVPHQNVREGRVGSLWIEVNSCGRFLMVYERDPQRDPETHHAKLKGIEYLGLDSVTTGVLELARRRFARCGGSTPRFRSRWLCGRRQSWLRGGRTIGYERD